MKRTTPAIVVGLSMFVTSALAVDQEIAESMCANQSKNKPEAQRPAFTKKCIKEMVDPPASDAKLAAKHKKEGVHLGMSKSDVIESSWGKPSHVNRSINASGEHEQWVYEKYKNGYLYFDNGVLSSIHN